MVVTSRIGGESADSRAKQPLPSSLVEVMAKE